ncbi:DUF421 domain-containing protein [Actinomadura miaoliensis]
MSWLIGDWMHLGAVAGKAALMYGTALLALRMGERRTLSQWTIIDFVAAVAVGAIVGRTAVASDQSFVTGAVALVTLIAMHRVISGLRLYPPFRRFTDHRVRVLVAHGEMRRHQLWICGVTESDLLAQLRQRGVFELSDVRFVLYEAKGDLTVVRESELGAGTPGLIQAGLRDAADFST